MPSVKLAILAAGKGLRMQPLTDTRPKPALPIINEPMICRHARRLSSRLSPSELIIVASYMKDHVADIIRKCYEGRLIIVNQGEERGTGDAIRAAIEASGEGNYIVVYSDLFLTDRAYDVISRMRPYTILTAEASEPWNYGVVAIKEGRLAKVIEKPPKEQVTSNLVYSGVLAIDHEFADYLRRLRPSPRGELEVTDALNDLAGSTDIGIVSIGAGDWLDVGRPWEYLLANRLALKELFAESRQRVKGDIHGTAVLEGPVIIDEGAEIGPYTVIEGPAYIGRGAKVGPSSHVRPETVIMEGAKVGYAVEVKASVLMENARAPHFNYVGDSVIGEDVNLGAGTITANLRFDHKSVKMTVKGERIDTGLPKLGAIMGGHSQTGINVSLMPGVKIGAYAIIYPGCVVSRDIGRGEVYKC
ncbi:MAG: bifunctional sugar-1-phosphate nucleotidylyltransferase/acetyltransferase [Acidilobus sp.]